MVAIEEEIEDYLEYCANVRRMSEVTIETKRCVMMKFALVTGIGAMRELSNEVFRKWMTYESERGVKGSTINTYNAVVVAMVRYCRDAGMVVPVNLALVPRVRTTNAARKFYTEEEILQVLKVADEISWLQIRIMFETGMRIAELARLRLGDFEGRRVRFVGKGKKMREVYISKEVLARLMAYAARNQVKDYLWSGHGGATTLNGEPVTANTIRMRLRKVFESAGFSGFYPHALRHSFATDLQRRGASVMEIKEMIGHSSVATTERYLHGFEGRMRELFEKYR